MTFATGQPVLLSGPNQTNTQLMNHLPNRVCDGRSDQLAANLRNNGFLWFNPSCFLIPPAGYFGDSGATVLNGPGINNWDIGIAKSIALTELSNYNAERKCLMPGATQGFSSLMGM
jgi:hypothetical protein